MGKQNIAFCGDSGPLAIDSLFQLNQSNLKAIFNQLVATDLRLGQHIYTVYVQQPLRNAIYLS